MIITIAKEKTITPVALNNQKDASPSTVTFRVPLVLEMEKIIQEKWADSQVFSEFCLKTTFTDAKGKSLTADELLEVPGTYPLIAEVAKEILYSGMLGGDLKNE